MCTKLCFTPLALNAKPEGPVIPLLSPLGLWKVLVGGQLDPGLQGTRTLHVRWRLWQRLSGGVRFLFAKLLLFLRYSAPVLYLKAFANLVPQSQHLLGSSLSIWKLHPCLIIFGAKKNPGPINHYSSETESMLPSTWLSFSRRTLILSTSVFIQHRLT